MGLVAGLACSPEDTRIVVCDADTGEVVRHGQAPHPAGEGAPEAPESWLHSLGEAAGGGVLEDVTAIGVAAGATGVVTLSAEGTPVRPAQPDDGRAQPAALALVDALGGRAAWAEAVGCVPQPGQPVTQLRRLAREEPEDARRATAVLQAQDWLVWQLLGRPQRWTTDRGGASATGYWSAGSEAWRYELAELAIGHPVALPDVLGPAEAAGRTPEGLLISAGTGELMAAALGLGLGPGDAVVSLGASGSVCAVHEEALTDPSGTITSYADATGRHLPIVRTLNATRVLRGTADLLGRDLAGLSELALASTPGAHGLVFLPYLAGERTPELPHTAGTLAGLRRESMHPEHLARAAFEGMLCGLADAADVLRKRGVRIERVFLLGAAAELPAVQALAPALFEAPVVIPAPADYTALGAARQAAWALGAAEGAAWAGEPPAWPAAPGETLEPGEDAAARGTAVRAQYTAVRDQTHPGAFDGLGG
ncbi:FGGY-family carbohydrate kinase [Streptomyces sp. DSM 44917]|uniref:FGGY-family carbohydrate kinase n=1 Tax=Streptomyces boetiae TaxID=3075541 RepID=A0ABU2LD89_9ACTN|nr:FGGY-family carbohydrate kinase [Streptomyces sp. DSM 44917]MDT0309477.1 FGGY-family carbohydrate kinase [Streptomyces sp. DSM 44917]